MKKIKLPEPKYLQFKTMCTIDGDNIIIENKLDRTQVRLSGGCISLKKDGEELAHFTNDKCRISEDFLKLGNFNFVPMLKEELKRSKDDLAANKELLLNQMSEKLEKEDRIRSLELELSEKKEDIKNLLRLLENCKNTIQDYEADEELLNQMREKLEEKRERIKSLEAKLAEKKEEIKKLQSKLSHLHTYSELKLTISEFEAFVNAYEKIGSNNVFSRDKKVTNEYWTHTSDGTFFEDLDEGTKVYILRKTIHPIVEEGE